MKRQAKSDRCTVIQDGCGGWWAEIADRSFGPYFNRDLALRVAVEEAMNMPATGQPCVVVYDQNRAVMAAYCASKICSCKDSDDGESVELCFDLAR